MTPPRKLSDPGDAAVDPEQDVKAEPARAAAPGPDWVERVVVHEKPLPGPLFKIAWMMMTLLLSMLVVWLIGTGMSHLGNELAGGKVF